MADASSAMIAVEEHYLDPELAAAAPLPDKLRHRLLDTGEARLAAMDRAGIAMQVLSHAPPGPQGTPGAEAVALARRANDRLAAIVAARPDRFAAFAALPTAMPDQAADELARTVEQHGFKGAMLHGLSDGLFHDDRRFRPIFARAAALDVPVYLHPAMPHPAVVAAYYADYRASHPTLTSAALGFTVEAMTAAIRLVVSGVFDAHPDLKILLGHMGEGVPFLMERIDESLSRDTGGRRTFRDAFRRHFWITTSGNFSDAALACSIAELGAERILFAVDWPFVENEPGTAWMAEAKLSDSDRAAIEGGNARRLLRL